MKTILWTLIGLFFLLIVGGVGMLFWASTSGVDNTLTKDDAVAILAVRPPTVPGETVTEAVLLPTVQLPPEQIAGLKAKAEQQLAAGQYNEALQTYTAALEGAGGATKERVDVSLRLARIYEQYGVTLTAEEFYRKALQEDTNNIEALYKIGGFHYDLTTGNMDEVRMALDKYRALALLDAAYLDVPQRVVALEQRLKTLEAQAAENFNDRGDQPPATQNVIDSGAR